MSTLHLLYVPELALARLTLLKHNAVLPLPCSPPNLQLL